MNLYVSNLNHDTTETDLRTLFSEFGNVVSAKVIKDPATGDSRGFGFVEMADRLTADDAMDNLDGSFLQGNIIVVKPAKQNNTKGGPAAKKPYPPRRYNTAPREYGDDFNKL